MSFRDELHRLVDTLPEGALEAGKKGLEYFQTWPPQQPPRVEEMREQQLERMLTSIRLGTSGTGCGGGSYTVGQGGNIESGSFGFTRWDDKTAVNETHRFHSGHEITITERLRMSEDAKALVYAHEVVGRDGTTERHEITFDVG